MRRKKSFGISLMKDLAKLTFLPVSAANKAIVKKVKKSTRKPRPQSQENTPNLNPHSVPQNAVVIESGRNLTIPVYGEHYGQNRSQSLAEKLYSETNGKSMKFSLTPICEYQRVQGFPTYPFANVNVLGSLNTDYDNWLGYISPFNDERADTPEKKERDEYVSKLINLTEKRPVVMHGIIAKEGSEFSLLLFASRKSIDEAYNKFVRTSLP